MKRYLFDLHCHTREHSYDGKHSAVDLVSGLEARGFDGVVITDHSYVWPDAELEELRSAAKLPEAFVLLSGQEVRTAYEGITWGDLLAYGAPAGIADGASPFDVLDAARAGGGCCIAAHAGLPRIGLGDRIHDCSVTAVEVWNGRYGPDQERLAKGIRNVGALPWTGGSDAHSAQDIGGGGTLLEECPSTIAELAALLREGRCKPWKPTLMGRLFSGRG